MKSGINWGLWRAWHARHCSKCSPTSVDGTCYFKLIDHFLRTDFDPPERKNTVPRQHSRKRRAYVDKWNEERKECEKAYAKWTEQCADLMSGVTNKVPQQYFPLLPVVRVKDRWKNAKDGTPYKVRSCLDLKSGGYNDSLED